MKHAILLFTSLVFLVLAHAQTNASAADPNRISITVSNDNVNTLSVKGRTITLRNNEALDSCLKKIIPELYRPSILLALPEGMVEERRRAIGVILEKFHCPVIGIRQLETAKPAAAVKLDAGQH